MMNDNMFPHAIVEIDNPEVISLFKKVIIPSSLGDETQTPPYPGKYANVLMVYEANGHSYLYSSDGIPTALGFDSGGILVVDEFPELEQAATNFLYIKRDTGEAQITTDNQDWTIIAGHYGAVYAVDAQPNAADAEPDSLYVDYTTGEAWLTHDNQNWITVNETGGKVLLVENFPDIAEARIDTLYISSTDQEARITNDNVHWVTISGGGGGGTTDFDALTNRPKYAGQTMTSGTDIPDVTALFNSLSSSLSAETLARQEGDSLLQQEFNAIAQTLQDDVDVLETQMTNKVDKEAGKGLSTNDFTNAYKALVDSAIQPSDLNYTVMTDLKLPTNPSTTSLILTEDLINIGTGATSDRQIALPVASTTQAGIINSATFDTIQEHSTQIEAILGGNVAIAGISATPTQAQLTAAWKTETGLTDLINGAGILDVDNNLKWTYYENDGTWHPAPVGGTVTIEQFTNTSLGTIKGSTTVGQVFAETDGTGSVNGWDALTTRVTNTENALDTKVDKVTGKGLSTNDFTDALKTKLDNIEAEAQKNSPLYSSTGTNTDGAMTQAAITNAIAQKLSHGNLTTSGGLGKTVTGSGTNTAIDIKINDGGVTTAKIADANVTKAKFAKYAANQSILTAPNLSPSSDTTTGWQTLFGGDGYYITRYSQTGKFTNQPSQYGYLETIIQGREVYQRWYTQTGGPEMYRAGNSTGWYGGASTAGTFRTTVYKGLANSITTGMITDLNVTTGKLANGAVTGVANNATAIGTAKLALNTVGTPNLRDAAVTSSKIDWTTINYGQERVIGTWLNGETLYARILEFENITVLGGYTSIPTGLTGLNIKQANSTARLGASVYMLGYIGGSITDDLGVTFRSNGASIDFVRRADASTSTLTFVVEIIYTKV